MVNMGPYGVVDLNAWPIALNPSERHRISPGGTLQVSSLRTPPEHSKFYHFTRQARVFSLQATGVVSYRFAIYVNRKN